MERFKCLTSKYLSKLGVSEQTLNEEQKYNLKENGYILIHKTDEEWLKLGIDIELISNVVDELIEKETWRGGRESHDYLTNKLKNGEHPEPGAQRLNHLLNKHECFRNLFTIPETLAAARYLIDSREEIALSQIILRMPLPGQGEQNWHVDWIPRRKESEPVRSVLSSLLLDNYTKENGTTRIVPGSHKKLCSPDEEGYFDQDHPDQVYIEAPRGTLLIYDINTWHRGGKNINGKKRRHININYRSRKIWQQVNFKKILPHDIKKDMSDAELFLLKARKEDKSRNEFLFKYRNHPFIKSICKIYWKYL
tara:strand:+ start:778 stop:1701 length:924 start_codon:yes stop_codon:yes gene_type:complete